MSTFCRKHQLQIIFRTQLWEQAVFLKQNGDSLVFQTMN